MSKIEEIRLNLVKKIIMIIIVKIKKDVVK